MKVKAKILLTRKLHRFAIKELQKRYHLHVHTGKIPMPKKEIVSRIKDVVGLVCFPYDTIDKKILDNAKKLRVISTYSVGYDHIDLEETRKRQIRVGYTPNVLTNATADLTIGLMLDLMRRITEGDRIIRADRWKVIFGAHDYVGVDLEGKTLGLFGMGRIGQAVTKRAKPFGMNLIYHSRTRLPKKLEKKLEIKYVSFSQLIKNSDVLSIHVPYGKKTHQIIDMKIFRAMKHNAFLINTARGKIINEKDLVWALKSKLIAGAALDVFESEPVGKQHAFTKMQNVVIAPHIGSSSVETRKKMAQITVQNLILGLKGKKMIYSI
jgi:glyoxylate reductase